MAECFAVALGARAHADPERATAPRALFGDGKSYVGEIILADSAAVASVPIVLAMTSFDRSNYGWSFFAMVAPSLTGPIVHLVHGRYGAAVISALGWLSFVGTSASLGLVFGITEAVGARGGLPSNETRGWVVGSAVAVTGAAVMTTLDAFLARESRHQKSHAMTQPYFGPLERGASLGISGSW